jgi:diaminopimelate decarboxylase
MTSPRSAKCGWSRETLPEATLCFMHPVKAEEAIAEAYFDHGVKTFSLDTLDELDKIVRATRPTASRDRPQPAGPHPRQLRSRQAQPRVQVRRRAA